MKKSLILAAAITLASFGVAQANIVGNWKTQSGETARISKCGSSFCIKLMTGTHKGRQIGKMKASGSKYIGTVTDPADDKKYSGSATVSGNRLKLKGCALKIFCKTQNWTR